MDFEAKYGPYTIVTGASAGLGEAFARELASRGLNLVLVARRQSKLDALAAELTQAHRVSVKTIALDLSRAGAVETLARETESFDVGSVVINAAQGIFGAFLDNDLQRETEVLLLNALAPLQIAHLFGDRLRRRGRGGLLFVSSLISFASGPFQANYGATKAFVTSFAQAFRAELAGSGVDVAVCAPGGMLTEGIQNSGIDFSGMPVMDPGAVARAGLAALGRRAIVVPGRMNAFAALLMKLLPRSLTVRMFGAMMTKLLGKRTRLDSPTSLRAGG